MGSEMVERVARAIFAVDARDGVLSPFDEQPASFRAGYMAQALAAMEAMGEPTQVMVDASRDAFVRLSGTYFPSNRNMRDVLHAALDAEIEAAKKGL